MCDVKATPDQRGGLILFHNVRALLIFPDYVTKIEINRYTCL
jgi:hypothetical protein